MSLAMCFNGEMAHTFIKYYIILIIIILVTLLRYVLILKLKKLIKNQIVTADKALHLHLPPTDV